MVAFRTKPISKDATTPRFIYVTGCDGTGKTTQAQLLLDEFQRRGMQPQHLWLRFPFFLTLPLLAYARMRGYSWYEETNGVRQGYWDFRRSWLLRTIFPWLLLVDAALAAVPKVYLPLLRGRTIVCERFVLDMVVDLAIALHDRDFCRRLPGRLFQRLLPPGAMVTILDLDAATIRTRRADLAIDKRLQARLDYFRVLVESAKLPVVSSALPVEEVHRQILQMNCANAL
jgi:thymidylate kinase